MNISLSLEAAASPAAWQTLAPLPLQPASAGRGVIAGGGGRASRDPYDVLRTRAGQILSSKGWTRLGVAQTRRGEAGPASALNLALSEARRPERRVVLVDLDLAGEAVLGLLGRRLIGERRGLFTEGRLKLDENLALLAFRAEAGSGAEILADAGFRHRLEELLEALAPDVTVIHVPAMLEGDAGLAAIDLCETVLLVVDGTADTPVVVREAEGLITPLRPLLGFFHYAAEA